MRLLHYVSLVLPLCAACSFHVSAIDVGTGDAAIPVDLAGDQGGGQRDFTMQVPDAGACMPGGPTMACTGDLTSLITCNGSTQVSTICPDGCAATPTAHCALFDPGGPAAPSDWMTAGMADITLAANDAAVFNTSTGTISSVSLNRSGDNVVNAGIYFRQAAQADGTLIGIFAMQSLTMNDNTEIDVAGNYPIAIVTANGITMNGLINAQGDCSGQAVGGGYTGGVPTVNAGGTGGPSASTGGGGGGIFGSMANAGGGGGGGFGDIGGMGATAGSDATGGAAGALFGDLTAANPILSGGGGGGAGAGNLTAFGGSGGAGGGAVQLASNGAIKIESNGVIQAGGCAGQVALGDPGGGGGGGAGGMILIEGRTITFTSHAVVVANGGSGAGGGSTASAGHNGGMGTNSAKGGAGGSGGGGNGSSGGDGGRYGELPGNPASSASKDVSGGGGGGAVGRIGLKQKGGGVVTTGITISPGVGQMTTGRPAPVVLGNANFD